MLNFSAYAYLHFQLIHAESNEWGIVVNQMLTEVVDRGRKLYSVDGSCIVNRWNGSSLACSLLSESQN